MKHLLPAIVIVLTFWLSTSAQSKNEVEVISIIKMNAVAFATNDLPMMERIWANSGDVVIFEGGHANYGWADYRDNHLVPEMKEILNTKFEITDIKPKVSKNLAYATMKYFIAGDMNGQHFESRGVGTAVLEKTGGKWKLVHLHTSSPRKS